MNQKLNEKGFTMVELIVVIAILGILGALFVPTYGNMTTKARLTTDIFTVKTLSRTAATYKAEQGGLDPVKAGESIEKLCEVLKEQGYIEQAAKFQTENVALKVVANTDGTLDYKLDVKEAIAKNTSIQKALDQMNEDAREWVYGYPSTKE